MVFVPFREGRVWQEEMLAALMGSCGNWGGVADVVVPLTDELTTSDLFWTIAEAHDADAYEVFAADQFSGKRLPQALTKRLRARLGVLGFNGFFEEDRPTSLGLAPRASVAALRHLPAQLIDTDSVLSLNQNLFLATRLGCISDKVRSELKQRGIALTQTPCSSPKDLVTLLSADLLPALTPWDLSSSRLDPSPLGPPPTFVPPVLVRGNDVWDFVLYYALMRMQGFAWWAPDDIWENDAMRSFILAEIEAATRRSLTESEMMLARYGKIGWSRKEVLVVSASDAQAAEPAADVLRTAGLLPHHDVPWEQIVPQYPLRYLEGGATDPPQAVILHDNVSGPLPVPVPKGIFQRSEGRPWVVNAAIKEWAPLRNAHGNSSWQIDQGNVRASREGLVFDADDAPLVPRKFRLTPLYEQLVEILGGQGWSARRSDKGAFAHRAAELFGGFEELRERLEDPGLWPMFRAFMSAKSEPGALGRWLSGDRRRVLTNTELRVLLSDDHPSGPLAVEKGIEELRRQEILQLGAVLKCRRCRQQSWYDIDAFGRIFLCPRCSLNQEADSESWMAPEPRWCYRIDESLLQFLLHNGDLPVIAADPEFFVWRDQVDAAFELDLRPFREGSEDDPLCKAFEIDIAVRYGTELWIGEATTQQRLASAKLAEKERLLRLQRIAQLTGARHVILATSGRWSNRTEEQIRQCFSEPWPQLHIKEECRTVPRPSKVIGRDS
jgi:hypothetical protein